MTLQIVPTNWYDWKFRVTDGSQSVANLTVSGWCEQGALNIGASAYRINRESWMSGAFILEREDTVLARAEKPSFFRREFVIYHRDREYLLRPESLFRRAFVLLDSSQHVVGSITPKTAFTRTAAADLPDVLPLPVRMFIVWLTMLSWRRQQNSSC